VWLADERPTLLFVSFAKNYSQRTSELNAVLASVCAF
jgi:hypothetical protein